MQTVTQYDTADRQNSQEYNRDFWALALREPVAGSGRRRFVHFFAHLPARGAKA